MKILMVIDLLNKKNGGGGAWRTYQMIKYLTQKNIDVEILTTNWDLDISFFKNIPNVKVHSINAINLKYLVPIKAKSWLRQNITTYDLVHISKNWSVLSVLAAKYSYEYNIPYIFSGMGMISSSKKSTILKFIFDKFYTLPMIKKAACCITVTSVEKEHLAKLGANENKIFVIPNGIDKADLNYKNNKLFRNTYNLKNCKIILFIGQMKHVKGVHLLIDAVYKIKNMLDGWHLVLVGTETEYRNKMHKKVIKLGLDKKITFLNPLFGKNKSMAYHACEFIIIPSISDAMTIIGPEAGYCKKPLLLSKNAQFEEMINNKGGISIFPEPNSIADGIIKMINLKKSRKIYGLNAHNYVNEKMGWDNLIIEYIKIFKSTMNGNEKKT